MPLKYMISSSYICEFFVIISIYTIELAEALTEIPTSISVLYEDILQDTTGNGRNISYFKKSLYDDLNR